VRKERARLLQAMSLERLTSLYAQTRQKFEQTEGGDLLRGVLLESHAKGPDGTRNWVSGYTPEYQRVILPHPKMVDQKSRRNELIDVRVNHWLVDRAAGEVSWIVSDSKAGAP
jgi:hypothetical protein